MPGSSGVFIKYFSTPVLTSQATILALFVRPPSNDPSADQAIFCMFIGTPFIVFGPLSLVNVLSATALSLKPWNGQRATCWLSEITVANVLLLTGDQAT